MQYAEYVFNLSVYLQSAYRRQRIALAMPVRRPESLDWRPRTRYWQSNQRHLAASPFIFEYAVHRSALSFSDRAAYILLLRNIYYIACKSLIFRILTGETAHETLTSPAVVKDQEMSAKPHRIVFARACSVAAAVGAGLCQTPTGRCRMATGPVGRRQVM